MCGIKTVAALEDAESGRASSFDDAFELLDQAAKLRDRVLSKAKNQTHGTDYAK
jgi:hypothetical protein